MKYPPHKPYTFAIATAYAQSKIAKEYVLPTLSAERKKEYSQQVTMYINHWTISDYIKVSAINKDSDKPKRSAYKCPTLHIPNVTCKQKKQHSAKSIQPSAICLIFKLILYRNLYHNKNENYVNK